MQDLLHPLDSPYAAINRSLSEVRELFYSKGRIADANAKLDETVKLMAIQYAHLTGKLPKSLYASIANHASFTIDNLNKALEKVATLSPFVGRDGRSIFGLHPTVAFEHGEEDLAFELFKLSGLAISAQANVTDPLDIVNEAFGHHVRDNFRSNTEDAQYMTPSEVVDFMVSFAEHEIFEQQGRPKSKDNFVVCDPCCGVGSFLVAWHRRHERELRAHPQLPRPTIIGQDKVDRMARLAKANLIFSGFESDNVFVGNSIEDESPLSQFDGQVDLILTNPPFGARFDIDDLRRRSKKSLSFFSSGGIGSKVVDSELLFVERYINLLRPGGLCVAVVPDGVVSAKGVAALTRQILTRSCELVGVIELPPVTFAQAGTRTKTAVLAFRKAEKPRNAQRVFFAEAQELGFEVSKRKGVPIKRISGSNDLPAILDSLKKRRSESLPNGSFSTLQTIDPAALDAWTPRRFQDLQDASAGLPAGIAFKERPLSSLVELVAKSRARPYSPGTLFISVLHVIGEGILDVPSMLAYRPITPGVPVKPGCVILSRLNPRIPRVLVVPDFKAPLLCSSEFEILEPRAGVSPYALAFLLLSSPVQNQVRALTAGTSASHSRVRPDEIRKISIPWPTKSSPRFDKLVSEYEQANKSVIRSITRIFELRSGKAPSKLK